MRRRHEDVGFIQLMSIFVKRHDVSCADNPRMNPIDQSSPAQQDASDISTALARWYAAHSSVRNLWAIDYPDALTVFVRLEPTSDGDETLPVWLAKNDAWSNDLRACTNRDVQLRLIVTDVLPESYIDTGSAMIAELSWRDPWATE